MIECLNENYSTNRLCYNLLNNGFLDKNGKIKEEYKFKLNFPEFNIFDSKIPAKEGEKFDTYLFLPEGEGRKGEGGLRTKGYIKFSYKLINDKWYFCNFYGNPIKSVDKELEEKIKKYIEVNNSNLKEFPLITVITVVFNGEKYLEETIQSVINQTYPNVEYIIIDGGSTDGTLDIIKKYENYIDYWVSEKDKGMYDALNKGIQVAMGNIIGIINSDDLLLNNILNVISQNISNFDFIYGNEIDMDSKGHTIKNIYTYYVTFKEVLYSKHASFVPHPTIYIKKKSLHKVGLYDVKYKYASDFKFILECLKILQYKHVDSFFVKFRVRKDSITGLNLLDKERISILREYGFFKKNSLYRNFMFIYVWSKFILYNIWRKIIND